MSFTELVAEAEFAIQNDQSSEAIPLLKEIITRAGSLKDKSAQESVQMARLQLGSAYSKLQRWADSKQYIQEYLAGDPCEDPTSAWKILCQGALANENWKDLQDAAQKLLDRKDLSLRDHETAEQYLVQALFNQKDYEKTLKMLPGVIKNTNNPDALCSYRIMQVRCLYETGQTDQVIKQLPLLFRGDSRDDITLNLTLLRIGDQLFDKQEYRKALAIYRLVLPKKALLKKQQERLDEFETAGKDKWRIDQLKDALESLRKIPDYDIHISYRAAQIYSEQKRFWEAVVIFDQIYRTCPDKEEGLSALFQKILLLFELKQSDEAIALSTDFLDKHNSGLFPRMICTRLMQYYLHRQQTQEALKLTRYVDNWTKPQDADELAQETDLRYMISFGYFQLGEYDNAFNAFSGIIQTAPDSQAGIDSHYWQAMCRLLQQKYELAHDLFMDYRAKWPRASFAPAALFRAGVCRFGLEDYEGAKKLFKQFITDYSDDSLMPEALTMYGDLLGADGEIDQALDCYNRTIKIVEENYSKETDPLLKSQMVAPATYAVLQASRTLEADAEVYKESDEPEVVKEKFRQIISLAEHYMKFFGKDADWAQGVFWVGKGQMALGETDKAVRAYLDAVIQYGNDPAQEGVAAILFDLANIIKKQLSKEQRTQTIAAIKKARAEAKNPTLQIQLDVLMAELDGTQSELGRELLTREKNLKEVPPSGLSLMCAALIEQKDYARAEEFFTFFKEHYDASLFMQNAYRLRAEDLFLQQKYDEAMKLADETLGIYGATSDTGWAQIMKGNIELATGQYKKAIKTFEMVFNISAWRGPVSAEAMFNTARAWQMLGNEEKAFAFFQRTYLLYKAYDNGRWAADAYLQSAECLRKMGRESAARNTYRGMLLDKYVRDLPQAEIAKKTLGPQETAELLAGRTNSMESVEAEVTP